MYHVCLSWLLYSIETQVEKCRFVPIINRYCIKCAVVVHIDAYSVPWNLCINFYPMIVLYVSMVTYIIVIC